MPVPAPPEPLRYNAAGLCVARIGIGKVNAASSVLALLNAAGRRPWTLTPTRTSQLYTSHQSKLGELMSITFEGALADRNTWSLENCSIAMSMDVIGNRSTILVLREALYGTTRFDDFVRRTHSTDAIVATRLKHLTELGVFTKESYREQGKRTRYEYVLTEKGKDLAPAVFGLMQWGNKYLQPENAVPLRLVQSATGEPVTVVARTESGAEPSLDDLTIVADSGLIPDTGRKDHRGR
jgi:DNA-binding HxlR family transcriptional regulator